MKIYVLLMMSLCVSAFVKFYETDYKPKPDFNCNFILTINGQFG